MGVILIRVIFKAELVAPVGRGGREETIVGKMVEQEDQVKSGL
jgi:hypothetical protein